MFINDNNNNDNNEMTREQYQKSQRILGVILVTVLVLLVVLIVGKKLNIIDKTDRIKPYLTTVTIESNAVCLGLSIARYSTASGLLDGTTDINDII